MRYALGGTHGPYGNGLSAFIQALPEEVLTFGLSERGYRKSVPPASVDAFRANQRDDETPGGLRPGDRIRHPAFGQGVVSKMIGQEKVEVLFRDYGRRVLHLGYTSLEKV
jgi:DNA helicase-2/ATP-dependent DNA helicase PcrA